MIKKFGLLMFFGLVLSASTAHAGATVLDIVNAGEAGTTGFVTANFTKQAGYDLAFDYAAFYIDSSTPTVSVYENGDFSSAARKFHYGANTHTQFNNGVFYVTSSSNVTQVTFSLDGDGGTQRSISVSGKAIR